MSTYSDIEIIENNPNIADSSPSANDNICQLCSQNLSGLTQDEQAAHYNSQHFVGENIRSRSKRKRSKPTAEKSPPDSISQMKLGSNAKSVPKDDVFWYPAQAMPPPDNYTPDVLSTLKEALKIAVKKDSIKRAVLCYERTPHIYHETFDTSWGCGYRNFMMTCAALMSQQSQSIYFALLDSPTTPSVRNLQQWIEDAWKHDYDHIGATQLQKLVDTKQKIGTAELYVAFTSRKIPCELVDFTVKNSPKGNFDTVTDWVVDYFKEKQEGNVNQILRSSNPVVSTDKMPVILQHQGHSVTIVGYELTKNDKINLLVLDPSRKLPENIRRATLNALTGGGFTSSSVSLGKGKRPERSNSPPPKKRSRPDEDSDDEIVSISDSDDEKKDDARQAATLKSTASPEKVIGAFRIKTPAKKKGEYQLLYFTMGDPLSDEEQNSRKVVLSTVVC